MLPPIRPQRQKIESPITDLSQDLKPESHDGWTFEENEYISITLLNTPFIDNKLFLAPEVCISIYFTRVLILHYRCESVSLNFKKLPKIALFTISLPIFKCIPIFICLFHSLNSMMGYYTSCWYEKVFQNQGWLNY